ncbi:conserved hypothetical protein [Burkholderia pseudomallei 668]|uniref:hypothetical protein n=1 Tax=Burkholderia pseudomallei TaxID=28450 RepID=UPI0000F28BC6|nr:hypothetical protein [Burkholderia pseudomallei]ABN85878.1 conserved hypothetical protein [Burkholderia pseudomallei 668]
MNVPAASGGPAARLPGPLAQAVARLRTADGAATDVLTRQTPRQHHSSEGIGVRPTAMPQRRERAPPHAERPRRGVFSRFLPFSAVFHCGHALRRPVPAAHARPACAIGRCRRHRLPVIVREIAAGVAPHRSSDSSSPFPADARGPSPIGMIGRKIISTRIFCALLTLPP